MKRNIETLYKHSVGQIESKLVVRKETTHTHPSKQCDTFFLLKNRIKRNSKILRFLKIKLFALTKMLLHKIIKTKISGKRLSLYRLNMFSERNRNRNIRQT